MKISIVYFVPHTAIFQVLKIFYFWVFIGNNYTMSRYKNFKQLFRFVSKIIIIAFFSILIEKLIKPCSFCHYAQILINKGKILLF